METFPAFFPLRGKRVVIAGEGPLAEAKARLFAGSPAEVVRVSGPAALDPAAYEGADLIFVASFEADFRAAAARAARTAGAPLNVVDAPELSDFHTPAIVDRGAVVAAVGTAGAAPLLASWLRSELEARIPEGAGRIAELLGEDRERLKQAFPDLVARRAFLRSAILGPAAAAAMEGNIEEARGLLRRAMEDAGPPLGQVTFIADVTAPDLLPLRAIRSLAMADVIVGGPAADTLLADHGRRDARRLSGEDPGEALLADLAMSGERVTVAGLGADPALVAALRARGVAVEVLRAAPSP